MADNTTTTAEITAAVDAWYNPELLVRAVSNFPHGMFGQLRDLPENSGETVRFRRYGNLNAATTALTEGVTPAGSQLSKADITATPLQYGDYVILTDKLTFTTLDPIISETSEEQADQAADTIDQLTRDVLVAGTTQQFASTANAVGDITAAMTFTAAEAREAALTLKLNKAKYITDQIDPADMYNTIPVGKCFIGIVHPKTGRDLKGQTGFVPVKNYPSNVTVMDGEIGSLDEIRFIETPNAKEGSDGSGGAKAYRTIVMAKNFYGITRIAGHALEHIIKPLGSGGTTDPLNQRSTMGWKITFIAKILNNAFGVIVFHGATQ